MTPRRWLALVLWMMPVLLSAATEPVGDPRAEAQVWFDAFGETVRPTQPFSFRYGERASDELLRTWPRRVTERGLEAGRTERTVTWTDPVTKLEVRVVAVAYADFPTVEWTVYFKNGGEADTPILSDIQALEADWTQAPAGDWLLHYSNGTMFPPAARDFMPQEKTLAPGSTTRLVPLLGRPTAGVMPYFNLERGTGSGVIVVLGWTGGWAAEFTRDAGRGVHVKGGLELTHLRLHAGEEIRSPLVVLQFWRGNWIDAQNTWRRWMQAHSMPRPQGRPPQPLLAGCSSQWYEEMVKADEASQLRFIDRYREEKFALDFWWMDAGWYENNGRWQQPRSLRVDRARFPRGLRAITDVMHARGLKSVVWFEPARIMPDNELTALHPEWLLPNPTPGLISQLLDLGNPQARAWLTEVVSQRIAEEGIDVYREDHCIIEMASIWHAHDAPDRQGITENHHVTGLYAYWDELHRRFPGLVIDSCGGGGSRNDLEVMRRALPFFRSDYILDIVSNQSQTYGLSLWLPFFGNAPGPTQFSDYELRSNFVAPLIIAVWDLRNRTLPYDRLRRAVNEWRSFADCYQGDFYPLTPCSLAPDTWLAWQFDRPDLGRGVVQAYRRAEATASTLGLKLHGLDPAGSYRVTNLDHPAASHVMTGRAAMEQGIPLVLNERPGAGVVVYERIRP